MAELAESKENVRAALNRAVHKGGRSVATASDTDLLTTDYRFGLVN
jgi:hypothetical protein